MKLSAAEIKAAYRALTKKWHSDKCGGGKKT